VEPVSLRRVSARRLKVNICAEFQLALRRYAPHRSDGAEDCFFVHPRQPRHHPRCLHLHLHTRHRRSTCVFLCPGPHVELAHPFGWGSDAAASAKAGGLPHLHPFRRVPAAVHESSSGSSAGSGFFLHLISSRTNVTAAADCGGQQPPKSGIFSGLPASAAEWPARLEQLAAKLTANLAHGRAETAAAAHGFTPSAVAFNAQGPQESPGLPFADSSVGADGPDFIRGAKDFAGDTEVAAAEWLKSHAPSTQEGCGISNEVSMVLHSSSSQGAAALRADTPSHITCSSPFAVC